MTLYFISGMTAFLIFEEMTIFYVSFLDY